MTRQQEEKGWGGSYVTERSQMARSFARCQIPAWSLALICLSWHWPSSRHLRDQTSCPWPCHSRWMPPPNTVVTDTRQSPFPLTQCSCPLPSLLPSWEPALREAVAWRAGNLSRGAKRATAEGCSRRPRWSLRTVSTPSREAHCGAWDGPAPQTATLTFRTAVDMHTANVGLSEPWLFSGRLTPSCCFLSLMVNTADDQAGELFLSHRAICFSLLGCTCRALIPLTYKFWAP